MSVDIKGEISKGIPGFVAKFTPIPERGTENDLRPRFENGVYWWEVVGTLKRTEADRRTVGLRTAEFRSTFSYQWMKSVDYSFKEALVNWSPRDKDGLVLPKYTHPAPKLIEGAYPSLTNKLLWKIWGMIYKNEESIQTITIPTLDHSEITRFLANG